MRAKKHSWIYPYLLVSPAFIVMLCVVLIPVIQAIFTSFMHFDHRYPSKTAFIGLSNYIRAFTQIHSFGRLCALHCYGWYLELVFNFFLVLFLHYFLTEALKAEVLCDHYLWYPSYTRVLIGLIWRWLYHGNYGVINDLLLRIGLLEDGIPFLSRMNTALPATVIAVVWQDSIFCVDDIGSIAKCTT